MLNRAVAIILKACIYHAIMHERNMHETLDYNSVVLDPGRITQCCHTTSRSQVRKWIMNPVQFPAS